MYSYYWTSAATNWLVCYAVNFMWSHLIIRMYLTSSLHAQYTNQKLSEVAKVSLAFVRLSVHFSLAISVFP